MSKKLTADFSDDPHNIRAFNIPLGYEREEIPLPEQEGVSLSEQEEVDLLTKMQQATDSSPRVETDINALEDRKDKFERYLASVNSQREPLDSKKRDRDVYDERDRNQAEALLLKSAQQVMGGAASQYSPGYKQDTSIADQLYKDADQPIKDQDRDIKNQQMENQESRTEEKHETLMDKYLNEIEKSDLDLSDANQLRDPNSYLSKVTQELTLQTNPDMNKASVSQMSAQELHKIVPQVQMLAQKAAAKEKAVLDKRRLGLEEDRIASQERLARLSREDRKLASDKKDSKEERLMSRNLIQSASTLRKDDKRLDNAIKQSQALDEVRSLMKSVKAGNQSSIQTLGTKLARAMGEVGVLTDSDVVRYVGSTSWGRKLKDWFTKGSEGKLPPELIKDLEENLNNMNRHMEEDMKRSLGYAYDRFEAAYPQVDPDRLAKVMGMPKKKVAPESDPRVESFMKKNGIKDKEKAIKILKDAGKL